MLVTKPYNRERAIEYARKWAYSRNPLFYDYTGIGGNCTNFVSQSIYAGSCTMNFTPIFGWYYLSANERTASWTGVDYFYNFMTQNRGVGPFGREVLPADVELGDVIQLGRSEEGFYHTLLVVGFEGDVPLLAAQSDDAFNRALDTYTYDYARGIHIDGVRLRVADTGDCFDTLLSGEAIVPNEQIQPDAPAPSEMPAEETPPAPSTEQ